MPVITMKMGEASKETKKELIEKLTATAAEVTNISPNSFTVFIEEYDLDNIGVSGQTLRDKFAAK